MAGRYSTPRERREALANDRLRTALDVISTFDGMAARQEQLDMQRGEMEARRLFEAKEAARLDRQAAKAEFDMENEVKASTHSAGLMRGLIGVDPDDLDALPKLDALMSINHAAGPQEKQQATLVRAELLQRREEFDALRTMGVEPADYVVELKDEGGNITGRRVDRIALGRAKAEMEREATYRSKLTNFEDVDLWDAMVAKGTNPRQTRIAVERHRQAENLLQEAEAAGLSPEHIRRAREYAATTVRDGADGTPVLKALDPDKVLGIADPQDNKSLREKLSARRMVLNEAGRNKEVAQAQLETLRKEVAPFIEKMSDGPEKDRALRAFAEFGVTLGSEAIQADEVAKDPNAKVNLPANRQASAAKGAAAVEAIKADAPTGTEDPNEKKIKQILGK
jgi:hypothetical protein